MLGASSLDTPTVTPLLRQYFPKGTHLDGFTEGELDAVAYQLNDRPRTRLDYQTPNEIIRSVLLR